MRKDNVQSLGGHVRRLGRQLPSSFLNMACPGWSGGSYHCSFLESRSVMIMMAAGVTVIACFALWLFAPTQGILLSFHGSYHGEHSARYRYGQSKKELLDRVKGLESVLLRSVSDVKYHEMRLLDTISHLSKKDSLISSALREVESAREAYVQELRANPEQLAMLRSVHPDSMVGRFGANVTVRAEWRDWLNECVDLRARCESLETDHAAAAQRWWQERLKSLHLSQVADGLTRLHDLLPFINGLHVTPSNASVLLSTEPSIDPGVRQRLEEFVGLWSLLAAEVDAGMTIDEATVRMQEHKAREEVVRTNLDRAATEAKLCSNRLWDLCGHRLTSSNWTMDPAVAAADSAASETVPAEDDGEAPKERGDEDDMEEGEGAQSPGREIPQLRDRVGLTASRDAYQIDPRLLPGGQLDVSFIVEVRHGGSQQTAEMIDRLYACTEGRRGDGHVGVQGLTSELVAVGSWESALLDPAWEAATIRTELGDFIQLYNVRPWGLFGQASVLSRGDLLVFLQDDAVPPLNCSWLHDVAAAFAAWPRLGVVGLNNSQYSYFAPQDQALGAVRPSSDRKLVSAVDPETGVRMQFVGVADVGPIVVRRTTMAALGGWNNALGHPTRSGPVPAFDLSLRTWLAGYHVAQLHMQHSFHLPFLGKAGGVFQPDVATNLDPVESLVLRERYARFADQITAEVLRLNAMLRPGKPWDP